MEVGCDVCFLSFEGTQRQPRVMPCGHTLCTLCVQDSINGDQLTCPFCRATHILSTPHDLPISYTLLHLATSRYRQNSLFSKRESKHFSYHQVADPKIHAGVCEDHGAYKVFMCEECCVWVCRDCTVVDHNPSTCTIIPANEAINKETQLVQMRVESLKIEVNQHLNDLCSSEALIEEHQNKHENNIKHLQELSIRPQACINSLRREHEWIDTKIEEGQKLFKEINVLGEEFKDNKSLDVNLFDQKTQEKMDAVVKWRSSTIKLHQNNNVISQSSQELEKTKLIEAVIQSSGDHPFGTPAYLLTHVYKMVQEMTSLTRLKYILGRGEVWVVKGYQDMAAPLTLQHGQLHLHALRKVTTMLPNTTTVPYECVSRLLEHDETKQTFLEISCNGRVLGSVYINIMDYKQSTDTFDDIHENSAANWMSQSYIRRCTGEGTQSFINTTLHKLSNTSGFNTRSIGWTDTPNINVKDVDSHLKRNENEPGMLTMGVVGKSLVTFLSCSNRAKIDRKFMSVGKVTQGLEILQEVPQQSDTTITITECGSVITK